MDIRNSITLTDRMTPVFRSINKAMMSTLTAMQRLDQASSKGAQSKAYRQAEADIKKANNALIKMTNGLHQADNAAKSLERTTGNVGRSMRGMGSMGLNLLNLSAGLYLLKNIGEVLSGLMETPDTMNSIAYRLGLYDKTDATSQQLFGETVNAALNSRSDLSSTGNLASRILISGATNGSGQQAIDLASIINKASFLGGSSPTESRLALQQLSQSLASGTMQGDELRAIREEAPGLMDAISKGLSRLSDQGLLPASFKDTTIGDLKKLGAEGELTAARIIAAFQAMAPDINEQFENSPKQFGQAMTQASTIWKYFLQLLSQNGGALDKINKAAWRFVEYMESPAGIRLMSQLGDILGDVADAVIWLFDQISSGIQWLSDHGDVARSIFVGLGTAAVIAGVAAAAAWLQAVWPILLVAAAFGILNSQIDDGSTKSNEFVGYLVGALAALGAVIVDILLVVASFVVGVLALVWDALVWVVTIVIWVVQGIVQAILWLWGVIYSVFTVIGQIFNTVFGGLYIVGSAVFNGLLSGFLSMGQGIVAVLDVIAKAIDAVFGSNLSATTTSWMNNLGAMAKGRFDQIGKDAEWAAGDIGDSWTKAMGGLGTKWSSDWSILDKFGMVGEGAAGLTLDPTNALGIEDWLGAQWMDPGTWFKMGQETGLGITSGDPANGGVDIAGIMQDTMTKLGLDGFDPNNFDINNLKGGNLDSVGKIKSDVNISDQDIQLLRDIAAREFLLNLQHITPTANIKFGDVRETADVNEIVGVIEGMVAEHMAASLVGG